MKIISIIFIACFIIGLAIINNIINADVPSHSTEDTEYSNLTEKERLDLANERFNKAKTGNIYQPIPNKKHNDEQHSIGRYMCAKIIENQAQYDYKWTSWVDGPRSDEWFQATSHMMDGNVKPGDFVFHGTSLKMQNGFGVWRNVTFTCVYDPNTESPTFLNVH